MIDDDPYEFNVRPETAAWNKVLLGWACNHPNMSECCVGCGHYSCPDCGLTWDDGEDFPFEEPSGGVEW